MTVARTASGDEVRIALLLGGQPRQDRLDLEAHQDEGQDVDQEDRRVPTA